MFALERAYSRSDSRICVSVSGRNDVNREGRVVSATVFGMKDEGKVKELRLLLRVRLVVADEAQEVFRRGKVRKRIVDVHGLSVKEPPFCLVCVCGKGGEARNQLDALPQDVGNALVLRVYVIRIGCKHTAGKLVHDVAGRSLHNHVLGEVVRESALHSNQLTEIVQCELGGKFPEQKKVHALLIGKIVVRLRVVYQIFNIIAAIDQFSGDCDFLAVLHLVSDNIANARETNKNTCSIRISQTTFHIEF